MSEPTAQEKFEELQNRESNADTVDAIATTGHVASGVLITGGAASAYGTGGMAALSSFAGVTIVPLATALIGAEIAHLVGLDKALRYIAGARPPAAQGPQPAVAGKLIAHNNLFKGILVGIVVAVAVGAAVASIIGSGGILAPAAVAAIVGLAAGVSGGAIGGAVGGTATACGFIIEGSPNVFLESLPAARIYDRVTCDRHSPPRRIIEGSRTIWVNDMPLARVGHMTSCPAVIQEGCKTIVADTTTTRWGQPDADLSVGQQLFLSMLEVLGSGSAGRNGGLLNQLLRTVFGDPVDAATGEYTAYCTDFEYPGVLPLRLERAYAGKDRVAGAMGTKWICNWSQRLLYDPEKPLVTLEDPEGQRLVFALSGEPFNAFHLKAPYYRLTGNRKRAQLFDTRTQQTMVFTCGVCDPHIGTLAAIEDRNGNRIDFFHKENRLHRIVHSDGEIFVVGTTQDGHIETVTRTGETEPLVNYKYDPSGALTDAWTLFNGEFHYVYTREGWLNHWQDSGATGVDLEYDRHGRVIATRTPEGIYNDRFEYFPEERRTRYVDATGAATNLWFDRNNLLVRQEDPLGNITEQVWDGLERKLSTTDSLGRVTRYDYDEAGRLTGETDWAGRATNCKYDRYGLPLEVTHTDGGKSAYDYDERGNLVTATEPDGLVFRFEYDACGRLVAETGPDGSVNRHQYAGQGREVTGIDQLGNRTAVRTDLWGRLQAVTNAAGHTTRYHYERGPENPRADLSRIIHPDGGEERFDYDREGLLAVHTGAEGQVSRYRHGAFDLLQSVIDPRGCITSLEYDNAARLKVITNAAGRKWRLDYDPAGRLAWETDWSGRRTGYIRDAAGRVLTKRLPDGKEQRLTWDDRDRIIVVESSRTRIAYEYDASDRLTRAATYDLTFGADDKPETDILLMYDAHGRLAREVQNGTIIKYRYDAAGRCINRKSPSGETNSSFDPLGLLAEYQSNGHGLGFERNALGLETGRRYGAGNAFGLRQAYDPCGRLKSQFAGRLRDAPAHEYLPPRFSPAFELDGQMSRRYRWDKSGRLTGVKDSARGSRSYTYDARDQVTRIRRPVGIRGREATEDYAYDELMNLARSGETGHFYEQDVVTRVGRARYTHDGRGRIRSKTVHRNGFRPDTWHYLWDDFDRLAETHTPEGACWRYTYDAFGRRVKKECVRPPKSKGKTSITYLWQGATLAEEWKTSADAGDETVNVSRWHFEPGSFTPIAKETLKLGVGAEKAGEARFYPIVTDHIGTPKEIFDTGGECLWQADHSLWGRMTVNRQKTVGDNQRPVVDCPLRFQNQWEDEESGLYYNLHRYYDPDSGQYLSPDPIGLEGGLRTHGYVHDPVQWVDPWGLCKSGMGAKDAPIGYTKSGEQFVRVGHRPENLRFTFDNPGGAQKGTYAFPEETFNKIGKNPAKLKDLGDLPGAEPYYYRILKPPPGTPIQRGTVPGGEFGGRGGVPEVLFPEGF